MSIERDALRRGRAMRLPGAANAALRRGLRAGAEGGRSARSFVTTSVDLGPPLLPLDNVGETLAEAESEGFR